jgi:Matrixin
MRPLLVLLAFVLSLAAATAASAADLPDSGFLVFKDAVGESGTVEVRDKATGRVVDTLDPAAAQTDQHSECTDARRSTFAAWQITSITPTYFINVDTIPAYLSSALARAQLVTSQQAWEDGFTTNCTPPNGTNTYDAKDGGNTDELPTLVTELKIDHQNTVGFASLDDTFCAGALACVIADFTGHRINEADLAFNGELPTGDVWTTSPTTWSDETGGEFALLDVATHEFGHFAGLNHALKSPELTMYPIIHDGDQTLGLGDMKGILTLY